MGKFHLAGGISHLLSGMDAALFVLVLFRQEMQKMQSDRPAKQLQTSPSNKQKLHGQHEELRQLRLLQEEVRKQEEVAKSQDIPGDFADVVLSG